jgi:hypothetical protein
MHTSIQRRAISAAATSDVLEIDGISVPQGGNFIGRDNVSITDVTAVPLPAAAWLLLGGLGGLGVFGRTRKAT